MSSSKVFVVFLLSFVAVSYSVTDDLLPKAICPLIKCAKSCKSGFRKDAKGCPTCLCVDPCENIVCDKGSYCVKKSVLCKTRPCYDIAECQICGPVCDMYCASGMQTDLNGCPICKCVDPCEQKVCEEGTYCERQKVDCVMAPCWDIAVCKPKDCGPVCAMYCASGMQTDLNGCPICKCVDPCEPDPCPVGMMCTRNAVQCITAPCYDVAECICPMYKCQACQYGYVVDQNGCSTCQCQDACVAIRCSSLAPYCYDGACHAKPKLLVLDPVLTA